MKIVISGASGLIGTHLVKFLNHTGHSVRRLVRPTSPREDGDIRWDPAEGRLDSADLAGADAVICLSGENIAQGPWTPTRKKRLRNSRIDTVALLSETIATMDEPPQTFICASAVGYYGSKRGAEILTEESDPGTDFLGQLCVEWEAAAQPAVDKGVRVAHLRLGIVLSKEGGALRTMALPFKFGLGAVLGSGEQYMGWLAIDDAVSIIDFVLQTDSIEGAINAVTPNPATNREFAKTLARVLNRPALLPVPGFAIRLAAGELGDALLLGSQRTVPRRLEAAGYKFRFPELESAMRHVMQR